MKNRNRILAISLILCMAFSNTGNFVFAEETAVTAETVEYIIRYSPETLIGGGSEPGGSGGSGGGVSIEQIIENNLTDAGNVDVIDELEGGDETQSTLLVSIDSLNSSETTSELNSMNGVYYAEPNYKIYKLNNDPGYSSQWAVNNSSAYGVNADKAWSITRGNESITIAVIDTGIDISHQDLAANIFTNTSETQNGVDSDNNGYKDDIHGWDFTTYKNSSNNGDNTVYDGTIVNGENVDEHGTHIAGIISAALNGVGVQGIASDSKILPVKILSDNDGTVFHAIKGIEYAEMMGAKIANCSWGSEKYSQFLSDAINNSSMLFVCAAGNDGLDTEKYPFYPAAYDLDNVISVGATDLNGNMADFSNYGSSVQIAAPGKDIYSTLPGNTYGNLSGTSMAAPFVSGAAALLISEESDLTAAEIKNRIISSASENVKLVNKIESNRMLNISDLLLTSVKPTDFNYARYGSEIIVVNNEIYSVGGYRQGQYLNNLDKFDPANKVWQTIANLPIAAADCAVASLDNKIFIVGGTNSSAIGNVQIYDVNTAAWQSGAAMPKTLFGAAYAQSGNYLYVFGGIGIGGYQKTVYKYDMQNNIWTANNDMSFKSAYSAAAKINGKIYMFGGCNETGCLNGIYLYDEQNDEFTYVSRLTVGRKDLAAVALGNKAYIFGGGNSYNQQGINSLLEYSSATGAYIESIIDTVEVFDADTKICTLSDSLEKSITGMSAANYFDSIYLLGGWSGVYESEVSKYFGAEIPKGISIKTSGNTISVKWNKVADASGYNVEVDGTAYESVLNSYQMTVSDNVEHKIRVQAKKSGQQSLWSDYIYHYLNSTMLDAKVISVNSATSDKLYKTGQTKWYKLNNFEAGKLTVSLNNIPANCNYLVQVCNTSGEVIATGTNTDGVQSISSLVLNPYSYYVKVSSVYGGSDADAYTLVCSYVVSSEDTMPDRVKSAFLKPSALDDLSTDGELKDLSEYEGEDEPPVNVVANESDETVTAEGYGSAMGSDVLPEEEPIEADVQEQSISLMSVQNSNIETGSIANQGGYLDKYVTVPSNLSMSSSDRLKLVVLIVPNNSSDVFELEWRGSNTSYNNFWYHWHGDNEYYLTALLPRSCRGARYNYRVTYNYKSASSTGGYTIKTYMIVDNYSTEDFASSGAGNDSPSTADTVTVSTNSSSTYTGKIDHEYDYDFYRVSVSNNQKLSAYLESPEGKWYTVDILDHTGSSSNYSSSQYMDGHLGDDGKAYAAIQTTANRNYMILVRPFLDGFSADSTYTLRIFRYNISGIGDLEVNNSTKQADTKMTAFTNNYLGSTTKNAATISFKIDSPSDIDYYAVSMAVGDKLSVQMEMPSAYNDTIYKYRIGVQDSEWIHTYNNPDSSRSKYATYVAQTAGTHYIFVKSETEQYNYNMTGTLKITKTLAANMDSSEIKTQNLPLYGQCTTTNDFIFTTVFGLLGYEFGIHGYTSMTANSQLIFNFDNELDVDWYSYANGSESKSATIEIAGNNMLSAAGIIVLDSSFTLLTSGVSGNTYTFAPNETYYIAAYVNDNKYSTIMSNRNYSITINESELRSDLVFNPLDWGTFMYDNSPEYLIEDDLADYNLGNTLLLTGENLSGVIDVQSSHSVKPYILQNGNVSFDILLYNPTTNTITVDLLQYGDQAPYETDDYATNATSSQWVALRAWADYLQVDLTRKDDQTSVLQYFTDFETTYGVKYQPYNYRNRISRLQSKGRYVIEPGKSAWVLGDSRLTLTQNRWSPMNLTARLRTNGVVNVSIAAFRNINNVYTPTSPQLIYNENTQRYYPDNVEDSDKEGDLDGKSKGIAKSVAEVEARSKWIINNDTTYFTPTVYNMANPNGYTIAKSGNAEYWTTNYNPNQDASNINSGTESDILPLVFTDSERTWHFDTRHHTAMNGNGSITGTPPIATAVIMGNYGVVMRYYIDITNTTSNDKSISYLLGTQSHAIIRYKLESENYWNTIVKCNTLNDAWNKMNDIFSVDIPQNSSDTLVFEVMLPNADNGGFKNSLLAY